MNEGNVCRNENTPINDFSGCVSDFLNCLHFAAEAHKTQKRKDIGKTPYINHPIGVALIVVKEGGICNLDVILASLLHDTVEDTEVTLEQICDQFGECIGNIIQEVTDKKSLPKQRRKDLQILHAAGTSSKGKVVKLADKLYNVRDLELGLPEGWTEERRCEYFEWAYQVCEGLRGVSRPLEQKLGQIFEAKGLVSKVEIVDYDNISHWETHKELEPLVTAADFAAIKHKSHSFLNDERGGPYINHVISSTLSLCNTVEVRDVNVLTAALLKDVVGKSDTKLDEVVKVFGEEVGKLVEELTFPHSSSVDEQFKRQMNTIENLSSSGQIITSASILDNCRRLEEWMPENWTESKRKAFFAASYQMCISLEEIPPPISEELNKIWTRQGLETIK